MQIWSLMSHKWGLTYTPSMHIGHHIIQHSMALRPRMIEIYVDHFFQGFNVVRFAPVPEAIKNAALAGVPYKSL